VTNGAEHEPDAATAPDAAEAGSHIHLPPPSWIPINVALSLSVVFVGLLGDIRNAVGPAMWLIGLLWLIAALAGWVRAARREFLEYPEDATH
jgi:hypothetical protein